MFKKKFDTASNRIHIISLSCNPVPPIRYGGIELVIAHLCEGLTNLGANVLCYSPGTFSIPNVTHVRTLSHASASVKDGGKPNSLEHLEAVCAELKQRLTSGDVVLFNHADHYRFLKKRLGLLNRLKAHFFEVAHWVDAGMKKNIIYPSKHLADQLMRPGIVIPHGEKLLFQTEDSPRNKHLFFAGRITKDKGVDIALEACKKLNIKLILAGPQNDKNFSAPIVADKNVEYLGELTYEELFSAYQQCRALIYMTQYTEPFGLSVIEAMAAGAPVITTGKGGTGETVIAGKTGFFANTVEEIIQAYNQLDRINSKNCITRAQNYTLDTMARSYLSLFTKH